MKYRVKRVLSAAALLLAFSLLLGACGTNSFSSVTPHREQIFDPDAADEPGEVRVTSYSELKNAILRLVVNGARTGVINIADYSSNVQSDVLSACRAVQTEEPFGVYAVEYMSYECVRILSYYQAIIDITYRRTPEQLASVVNIKNANEFRDTVEEAIRSHSGELTMNVQYYYSERYTVADILDSLLLANPLHFIAQPKISTVLFPEAKGTGWSKVIDLKFDWGVDAETLAARRNGMDSVYSALTAKLDKTDAASVQDALAAICGKCSVESGIDGTDLDTPYSALVEGVASTRGVAGAVAGLCELAGIEYRIVNGSRDGVTSCWNMLRIGKMWYHVDATVSAAMIPDSIMNERYEWQQSAYPLCRGELLPSPDGSEPLRSADVTTVITN